MKTVDRTPLTLVHNTTSSADSPFKLGADFNAEDLKDKPMDNTTFDKTTCIGAKNPQAL